MKDQIVHFATGHPKKIMWLTLVLTLIAGAMIPRIHIDTDPENMLPPDQRDRVIRDRIKEQFNLYDLIVVGIVNDQTDTGIFNHQSLAINHETSIASVIRARFSFRKRYQTRMNIRRCLVCK